MTASGTLMTAAGTMPYYGILGKFQLLGTMPVFSNEKMRANLYDLRAHQSPLNRARL